MIGGGPAGTATAVTCAERGLSVILLESFCFPRERPGETLHPGVEPLLRQLGVWEEVAACQFLRHSGQWVTWGDRPHFASFGEDDNGPWLGFQAWRAEFDELLIKRAQSLGVEILQPCHATSLLVERGRVAGVVCSKAGSLRARFVIDAAGGRHWLGRRLALPIQTISPKLIAYYGYGEGECPERDEAPSLVADRLSWTWTARVRPGLYQWTRLVLEPPGNKRPEPPTEFDGLKLRGMVRGHDVTWRFINESAGEGYFLVGDAAAVLDPSASHGVLRALMSGIMVGHSVCRILDDAAAERQIAQAYREWLTSWFNHDVHRLTSLYKKAFPQLLYFAANPPRNLDLVSVIDLVCRTTPANTSSLIS